MRNDLSDFDVLAFTLAGCNAAEIAAYAGISEDLAQTRIDDALRSIGHPAAPKMGREANARH